MKRSTFDGRTAVYQYGCPAKVDVPDAAMHQLRLANRLWNDLVAIHKDHQDRVAGVWESRPEVETAKGRLAATDAAPAEAVAASTQEKKDERSRTAVPAELRATIVELRAAK